MKKDVTVFIYARVSTEEQAKKFSIPAQIDKAKEYFESDKFKEYCETHNLHIKESPIILEEDESSVEGRARTKYQNMIDQIQDGWNSPEKTDTLKSLSGISIILQRALLIQCRVSSLAIVKDFNVLKDGPMGLIFAVKSH